MAHGFVTLTDDVEVHYKVDNLYAPKLESGIIYNDPDLKVDWGTDKVILSLAKTEHIDTLVYIERVGPARDGSPHNMRGIDITEWTAPLSQLTLLGLHTIGVGDGGNEIGMGRVEDYAIEGVVDHGENIACTVPTDQLVVAGTSNWGAHALVCAMRALGRSAVDPYLEPTWQERVLDVIVEYGGLDGVHMTNVATVDGLEPDRYFKQVGQLTDCARS